MKLSQIEKRIPQTWTNSKNIIQTHREYARRSSRARSTRGQENEAWALYKKFHPGSAGVTFLGTDTSFAQSHPPLLEKYLIEGNCSSQPITMACYKEIIFLSNYIQLLALVLRKFIKHQQGKVIRAKERTTKDDLQNLKRAKDISEFWLLPRHLYNRTKFKERCITMIHIFNRQSVHLY